MSIVDRFGKKEPKMPVPSQRQQNQAPYERHAEALAFLRDINDEAQQLRAENGRLRADLNVAMMRNRDLEREIMEVRNFMEAYRRYSVTVKTHLQHIMDSITRANEEALEAGENVDKPMEKVLDHLESEIKSTVDKVEIAPTAEQSAPAACWRMIWRDRPTLRRYAQ